MRLSASPVAPHRVEGHWIADSNPLTLPLVLPDASLSRNVYLALLAMILIGGGLLRFYPSAAENELGLDEFIYERYVHYLDSYPVSAYPDFCAHYLANQRERDEAILPPTRFAYVFAAHIWRQLSREAPHAALLHVSAFFSLLALVVTAGFSLRLGGRVISVGVTALMSVGMNQIHQAQHAMIDGFFTCWTLLVLWALWESLRAPAARGWLITYAFALAVLVMTKEAAFFVFLGVCALLISNRWLRFGTVTRTLLLSTFGGATAGFLVLVLLAGGLDVFIEMYRLLVEKSRVVPYAVMHNDGPWYRYLVDLVLISPIVVLLAAGAAFQTRLTEKPALYLLIFMGATFALMASVQYAMNVRYATIWDLPLRYLAFLQLTLFAARFARGASLVLIIATCALCALELRQYYVFCVASPSYSLVPQELLRAVKILK